MVSLFQISLPRYRINYWFLVFPSLIECIVSIEIWHDSWDAPLWKYFPLFRYDDLLLYISILVYIMWDCTYQFTLFQVYQVFGAQLKLTVVVQCTVLCILIGCWISSVTYLQHTKALNFLLVWCVLLCSTCWLVLGCQDLILAHADMNTSFNFIECWKSVKIVHVVWVNTTTLIEIEYVSKCALVLYSS